MKKIGKYVIMSEEEYYEDTYKRSVLGTLKIQFESSSKFMEMTLKSIEKSLEDKDYEMLQRKVHVLEECNKMDKESIKCASNELES